MVSKVRKTKFQRIVWIDHNKEMQELGKKDSRIAHINKMDGIVDPSSLPLHLFENVGSSGKFFKAGRWPRLLDPQHPSGQSWSYFKVAEATVILPSSWIPFEVTASKEASHADRYTCWFQKGKELIEVTIKRTPALVCKPWWEARKR